MSSNCSGPSPRQLSQRIVGGHSRKWLPGCCSTSGLWLTWPSPPPPSRSSQCILSRRRRRRVGVASLITAPLPFSKNARDGACPLLAEKLTKYLNKGCGEKDMPRFLRETPCSSNLHIGRLYNYHLFSTAISSHHAAFLRKTGTLKMAPRKSSLKGS